MIRKIISISLALLLSFAPLQGVNAPNALTVNAFENGPLAITPNGATVYYMASTSGSQPIHIFDTAYNYNTGTVSDPSNLVNTPGAIAITPDGTKAYVANNTSTGRVCILNTTTNTVTGQVTDGSSTLSFCRSIAITPDSATAYVVNRKTSGTVSIINVATDTVTGTISVGTNPQSIAITPDGTKAYVVNNGNNSVSIITIATNTNIGTVSSPNFSSPQQIAISPDGSKAYVTNASNNTVSIINVSTNAVIGTVSNPNFSSPRAVVFTPDGTTAYVGNFGNNTISVINATTDTVTGIVTYASFLANNPTPTTIVMNPNGTIGYANGGVAGTNVGGIISYVASPGQLDTTFGNQGATITPISKKDYLRGLALTSSYITTLNSTITDTPMPNITVAGTSLSGVPNLSLAQYTPNGALNTAFNSAGTQPGVQMLLVGSRSEANASAIENILSYIPDQNILTAGFTVQDQTNMLIARYTSTGTLDTSYNGTGYNTVSIGQGATATALGIQSIAPNDQKSVIAGTCIIDGVSYFALARFNTDGTLDTSFGSSGITITPIGILASVTALAIDPQTNQDRIVVVGNVNNQITLACYTPNGILDTSFNSGGSIPGILQIDVGYPSIAYDALIDYDSSSASSGSIVVAGSATVNGTKNGLIIRCTPNGALDTSFNALGTPGYVIQPIAYGGEFFSIGQFADLLNGSFNYYIAGGYGVGALSNQLCLAEYFGSGGSGDGTLNTAFGTNGITLTTLGTRSYIDKIGFEGNVPYGIIAAGLTNDTFFVARYGLNLN